MAVRNKGSRAVRDIDADVGNRIRAYRIDRGLSQEQLGEALGVSFQQVQKYEKGVNRLSIGRLFEMCKFLDVTPHELIGWGKTATKLGNSIDVESFKLAKELEHLKPPIRPAVLALIKVINGR